MEGQNGDQLGQEGDPIKKLDGTIQAPIEQIYQGNQPVSGQHVVPVFLQTAKDIDDLDAVLDHPRKVLDLILVAMGQLLTDLSQYVNDF